MSNDVERPHFGPCGFHWFDGPPLPKSFDDAGWDEYGQAEIAAQAEVPDAEMEKNAKDLIKELNNHWCLGVYALQGLAALATEKKRRLVADDVPSWKINEVLAAWFALLDPSSPEYAPDAKDCANLLNPDHKLDGSDGLGRPWFLQPHNTRRSAMTNYQKILETAALVLVADNDSPAYGALLSEALASLSREELLLVTVAQKLLDRGAFFISSDNPETLASCRQLAEHMGATISENGSRPRYFPDDVLPQQTSLTFRMSKPA